MRGSDEESAWNFWVRVVEISEIVDEDVITYSYTFVDSTSIIS